MKPPALWIAPTANEASVDSHIHNHAPQTPSTPVSAEAVIVLQKLIQQDACLLNQTNKLRLQKHVQKVTNATQLSFAERALLREYNQSLINMNNEAKVRRSTKSKVLGTARVMSYEDLLRARADRARKEREKEVKRNSREAKGKRAARKPKEPRHHAKSTQARSGGKSHLQERKSAAAVMHAPEPEAAWPRRRRTANKRTALQDLQDGRVQYR